MKKFLLLCFSFGFALSVWAQDRVVTGRVTSKEDGSALPGVNVVFKGTTNGTVTDADGKYSITVPSSGGTLVFTFIGLKTEETEIGERTVVDLAMEQDVSQLSEVVVTGLAISKDVKQIGYAVGKVKSDELNMVRVPNGALALSGLVSGLQINQTDNGVNNSPRIVLRGNRSFLGNNQALIVIDGLQVSQDAINTLNPLDIESVSVLKGIAAAALYGSSAANGVILYTTRTGTKNKAPEINFSNSTQLESVAFLPKLQQRFGNYGGESFGSASAYALDPNFVAPYIAYENQNYGPEFNGKVVPLGYPLADGSQQYTTYLSKYNDHLKFWNTGVQAANNLSVTVGGDKTSVHFSFQDMNRSGVTPRDVFRRDVFRVNATSDYGKVKLDYRVQYTQGDQNVNFAPGANRFNTVYWNWMNVGMSVPLTQYSDWRNNKFASPSGWYDDFYFNPYWLLEQNRRSIKTNDFMGVVTGTVQATKWLSILGRVGMTTRNLHQSDRNGAVSFDPTIVYPISSRLSTPGNSPAGVAETFLFTKRINIDVFATLSHDITPDLNVKAIIGGNVFDDYGTGIFASSNTLQPLNPTIYNLLYRNGNINGGNGESRTRRLSTYQDVTLNYKGYLTLHGSHRNDQTSLLAKNNRSFNYPEIDAAFVISDAIPSLFDNNILSFAKVSASWAKVGNISVGPYALQNVFIAGSPYSANGNVPTLFQGTSQISQNLKPEFSTGTEYNLDLGFWQNRIVFGATYYQTNTTNQTVPYGVSPSTGYTTALVNVGEMLNQGIELDLNFKAVQTSYGLKWSIKPNYTHIINNKVLSIVAGTNSIVIPDNGGLNAGIPNIATPTANPINSFAVVGRQYPDLQTSDWVRDPQGHVVVDAVTGNPQIAPGLKSFGQANPVNRLGITNTVEYKNFTFQCVVDYRAGNVIYNQLGRDIEFTGIGYQSAQAGRQPFVFPNSVYTTDEGVTYKPNTNLTVPEGNIAFWTSTYGAVGGNYVTKADFWKLRNVSLTYKLPTSILSKTKYIKAATVSITGRNLLMWRPKTNQWTDPEFAGDNSNAVGVTSAFQNPPSRLYGAQINLTF